MKRLIGLSVLAVLCLAGTAFGADVPYEPGKVSVFVPEGWTQASQEDKKTGQAMLVAADPTQNAGLVFAVMNAANLKKAMKGLDKHLKQSLTKIKKGKFKKVDVNGMKGTMADGTAVTKDGKAVSMFLILAETPNKKVLLVLGMVATDKKADFADAAKQVLAGIKPLP